MRVHGDLLEVEDIAEILKSLVDGISEDDALEPVPSMREIIMILRTLENDISPTLNMPYEDQSATHRRTLIRSVFALIEGLTYRLKQAALEIDDVLERRLTEYERVAIREQAVRIDDRGYVQLRAEYPAAIANVRFAFNVLEKVTTSQHELEVNVEGWEALRASLGVRDRITHPKQASDLEIPESEIKALAKAHMWFLRSFTTALLLALRGMAIIKLADATGKKSI